MLIPRENNMVRFYVQLKTQGAGKDSHVGQLTCDHSATCQFNG